MSQGCHRFVDLLSCRRLKSMAKDGMSSYPIIRIGLLGWKSIDLEKQRVNTPYVCAISYRVSVAGSLQGSFDPKPFGESDHYDMYM